MPDGFKRAYKASTSSTARMRAAVHASLNSNRGSRGRSERGIVVAFAYGLACDSSAWILT